MDEATPTRRSLSLFAGGNQGGWITFPFIIASMAVMTLSAGGWVSNLIVYLIQEYNIKSINAAKISNVVVGCTALFPIIGAIIADSFLGCFPVIWISSLLSLLGTMVLVMTAAIKKLRPLQCVTGSDSCISPSGLQIAVLYIGLALLAIGVAGSRFTIVPMGAYQLDKPKHQKVFFNWYIVTLYTCTTISSTAIVYVEDNVSWAWGFGICLAANVLALIIFLSGNKFYRHLRPHGSPFVSLARVVVVSIRRRNVLLSPKIEDYCQDVDFDSKNKLAIMPTNLFRFLNRASLKAGEETGSSDEAERKSWKICSVQEVEDFKSLIKILPLWSSCLFLSTPLVIQSSMSTLQAISMDRHLGTYFKIPVGSMLIFVLLSTSIGIIFLDRLLYPLWDKFIRRPITPLQRVGIGHLLTILSMAVQAMVESRRLKIARDHGLTKHDNAVVPMSVFWLVIPLGICGIGESFHFPGQIGFYYQEFPASLKSTSTAFVSLYMGIAYYIGNGLIDLVRRTTMWLPDNINEGRLDNMFWLCGIIGVLNFGYYLVCALFYKYQNQDTQKMNDDGSPA